MELRGINKDNNGYTTAIRGTVFFSRQIDGVLHGNHWHRGSRSQSVKNKGLVNGINGAVIHIWAIAEIGVGAASFFVVRDFPYNE
ncbi:hypothetical protein AC624_14160 [Bacillus sp. FJAT-27238]|nr:hypothetical protein AC624_14160 [Bacillus sp. FJAT-27238]